MTSYKAFRVEQLQDGKIVRVSISRPKAMNAMNPDFFNELNSIFRGLNDNENVRVAILVGDGKLFTAGLDLKELGSMFNFDTESDSARNSVRIYQKIKFLQKTFLSLVECRVPILVGIHNLCIGGGMDLISMGDIRYCTKDAKFTIKQIDIGMAADLGTLQYFPNIIGNDSTYRELAFTGRMMDSQQALSIGLVSKIFDDRTALDNGLLETAKIIASKSPVGIYTLKQIMNRQQSKKVSDGLEYMARTNSAMLQTKDTVQSITAFPTKRKASFPKL